MLELTPHAGRKPFHTLKDWGVYFPYVAQSFRSKKFDYPKVSLYIVYYIVYYYFIICSLGHIFSAERSCIAKSH